jgi:hypothetical protein
MADSIDPTKSLQGQALTFTSMEDRRAVVQKAFDYRGDVTLTLSDGTQVQGYIFDQRLSEATPTIRVMLQDTGEKVTIGLEQIAQLSFSGRDTADGKSWETWVRKYREKKAAGEAANIHAEDLDE